jgi:hypothetical protein
MSEYPKIRVFATPTKGKDLLPGDLFSTAGPEYWKTVEDKDSIGERVYIRTNSICPKDQEDIGIFLIEIVYSDELAYDTENL